MNHPTKPIREPSPPLWENRPPKGIGYFRGFRILGTALGFHRNPKAHIIFRAHPDAHGPRRDRRHLTAVATGAALGLREKGIDALMLDFHRSIRLGQLEIQILPAGMGPTTAQILVNYKGRRILFCDGVRLGDPLCGPHAATPECDLLLLDFEPATPRPPSPGRTARKAVSWSAEILAAGETPVMVCGSLPAACDLAWQLQRSDVPVRGTRPIFEALRRLAPFGFTLPRLRRLEQTPPADSVILHRLDLFPRSPFAKDQHSRHIAYAGPAHLRPEWAGTAFRLGETEDRAGLGKFIERIKAPEVALGPGVSHATATAIAQKGHRVHRVSLPAQMPLPNIR